MSSRSVGRRRVPETDPRVSERPKPAGSPESLPKPSRTETSAAGPGGTSIDSRAAQPRASAKLAEDLRLLGDLSAETVEQMPLGFVTLDTDLHVTYANPIALGLIGIEAAELLGRRPWDLFPEIVGTRYQTVRVSAPLVTEYEEQIGPRQRWIGVLSCPTRSGTAVFLRDISEGKRDQETVRRLVALLHGSLDAMLDAFLVCAAVRDAEGVIVGFKVEYANSVAGEFLGRAPGTLIGELMPDWAPDISGKSFVDACREVVETGEACTEESVTYAVPRREGTRTSSSGTLAIQLLRFNDGFFATWRDVTEWEAMRRERDLLAAVLKQMVDGVVIIDAAGMLTYANPAFLAGAGMTLKDAVGQPAADVASRLIGLSGYAQLEQAALAGRPWLQSVEEPDADGTTRHLQISMTPVGDADQHVASYVLLTRDVTQLHEAEAELALQVRVRTALAESFNKIPAEASLEEAAQAICDALVTLPFVGMAAIQIFLGGDDVQILAQSAPPGYPVMAGTYLTPDRAALVRERSAGGPWARYADSDPADGGLRAAAVRRGLKALAYGPIGRGDHIDGTLVLGTFDETVARMVVEKMPGIVSFGAASNALLADRMHSRHLQTELHDSLSAVLATQAYHPVFQPIIDLESSEVVGYEGLTRFDTGQRPDLCFADAWAVGLGPAFEFATLEAAVAASQELPPGVWLDLNVTPRLLADADRLGAILRPAERPIVLEITEHELIEDYDVAREAIRSLGRDIRVAVDDAGAGVANFGHIIDIRPDFVKLDISLVRRVNSNLGRQAMVVGMRHFARTAGCRLVAEGIETLAEARTLRGLGVEFGQGYLFGHPVPVDKLGEEEIAARKKAGRLRPGRLSRANSSRRSPQHPRQTPERASTR